MWAVPRRRISMRKGMFANIMHLLLKRELIDGRYIEDFEQKFAAYIGTSEAISISSGTAALSLILEALSLKAGDEVILPAYTFPSVPAAIKALDLAPSLVDIDPYSDNMDIASLKDSINEKTKVIVATHLFGKPCDIDALYALAKRKNIFIIEDCAHATGSKYKGKRVGSLGDAAFFSFSLTKPFNTFNGGMITSNNSELMARIREKINRLPGVPISVLFKNISVAYLLSFLTKPAIFSVTLYPLLLLFSVINKDLINSYNRIFKKLIFYGTKIFRFSNLQALIGINALKYYEQTVLERAKKVRLFNGMCKEQGLESICPAGPQTGKDIFHYFYIIKHPEKDVIARKLLFNGVDTGKYVMRNCARFLEGSGKNYFNTEYAYTNSLQLPVESCSIKNMRTIVKVIKRYLSEVQS